MIKHEIFRQKSNKELMEKIFDYVDEHDQKFSNRIAIINFMPLRYTYYVDRWHPDDDTLVLQEGEVVDALVVFQTHGIDNG